MNGVHLVTVPPGHLCDMRAPPFRQGRRFIALGVGVECPGLFEQPQRLQAAAAVNDSRGQQADAADQRLGSFLVGAVVLAVVVGADVDVGHKPHDPGDGVSLHALGRFPGLGGQADPVVHVPVCGPLCRRHSIGDGAAPICSLFRLVGRKGPQVKAGARLGQVAEDGVEKGLVGEVLVGGDSFVAW